MADVGGKKRSPWQYLILVPLVAGIGIIVALMTGPVAKLAVPVVVLLVLGAFVWDMMKARKERASDAQAATDLAKENETRSAD